MDDKNVFPLGKIPSNKKRDPAAAPVAAAPARAPVEPTPAERDFVEAARTHSVPAPRMPDWQTLDPEERCTRGINVRFNDYELGLLHRLAKLQDRSVHQTIKRRLIPAARELSSSWSNKRDQTRRARNWKGRKTWSCINASPDLSLPVSAASRLELSLAQRVGSVFFASSRE